MKVRVKNSSFRLTIGIQFLLYSANGEPGGYHSSKEGWPLAGRLANAGFRLKLPRNQPSPLRLEVPVAASHSGRLEHGARIGEVHFPPEF